MTTHSDSISMPREHRSFTDWLLIAAPLLFIATVLWMEFYPVRTLEPRTQPYHVVTPIVETGQAVTYEVDACKYTTNPAQVYRQLVSENGDVISLPSVTSNLPQGCNKNRSSTTAVPTGTTPGVYHLQLTLVYQVYGFRSVSINLSTEEFTVTAPKEQIGQ